MSTTRRNRSSLRNRRRPNYSLVPVNDAAYIKDLHGESLEEATAESEERLESFKDIEIGNFVKLDFAPNSKDLPSESMWVQIVKRSSIHMTGILLNDPVVINAQFGDRINLAMKNVRHVERPKARLSA